MIELSKIIERLKKHEGLSLMPYKCPAGYLTIGYGRNLINNPLTEAEKNALGDWTRGITPNGALMLLKNDIYRTCKACQKAIHFWKHLDDERQYALLDMAFNMGLNSLLRFKKMLAAMEIGDYQGAAKEVLHSKYAKDVGRRAVKIAKLIETGDFKDD